MYEHMGVNFAEFEKWDIELDPTYTSKDDKKNFILVAMEALYGMRIDNYVRLFRGENAQLGPTVRGLHRKYVVAVLMEKLNHTNEYTSYRGFECDRSQRHRFL